MNSQGVWIDQILADERTTPQQRRRIKAVAALFANVLWDNDFVPLDNDHGLNLGTANMPVQQSNYRHFYALLLANHPTMREHARRVAGQVKETVRGLVNEHGAEIGCPHYIGASFAPTLNTLLQVKQLEREDPFQGEPRLARFAEFYLNLMTPPEPRVGGRRALISLGDGSTEPSELYGVLATGFRNADPPLSARLMGAWAAHGKVHSDFFGTTVLKIDERLPAADPQLGDANFPGYLSVLRHGWNTPDETAVWFVNGDHYSDHRHYDHGSVVIYALGKPLSIDWGSLYTPRVPGAYYHNTVVLEKNLGHPWDQDSPPLDSGGIWSNSTQEAFTLFQDGAYARARFEADATTWTREVASIRADPARPILLIRDTFRGEAAGEPKVLALNLMAEGDVETPAGKIRPPERTHPPENHNGGARQELASSSPPFSLPAGTNRMTFQGRYGVGFHVYTISDGNQQAIIGNWAVTPWGLHVTDKQERQHILRIRGTGPFTTLILPYREGQSPKDLQVSRDGDTLVISGAGPTVRIRPDGYAIDGPETAAPRRFPAR
jgi:hypothetical protein